MPYHYTATDLVLAACCIGLACVALTLVAGEVRDTWREYRRRRLAAKYYGRRTNRDAKRFSCADCSDWHGDLKCCGKAREHGSKR